MKTLTLLFLFALIFISCSSSDNLITAEEKNKIIEKKESDQQENEKLKIRNDIILKYGIKYNWDTLHYPFTNDYIPIIESRIQLINHFYITDIYQKDSTEYVSILLLSYPAFYFDFEISKDQEKLLRDKDSEHILVVNVSEIKKIKIKIEGEVNDEEITSLDFTFSQNFIGKGKLIDILSFKSIKHESN